MRYAAYHVVIIMLTKHFVNEVKNTLFIVSVIN